MRRIGSLFLIFCATALPCAFQSPVYATTYTTLASFDTTTGSSPSSKLLVDSAGNLYGTTEGGIGGQGTVFKMTAANNYAISTLASFNGLNGAQPNGGLIADAAGNLYGTTIYGGANSVGTAYKLDASNNYALTTLATLTFNGPNEPYTGLIADAAGNLYGTTGGDGFGTVYKLTASNSYALSTLVHFNGTNGNLPFSGLIADAVGNLYGTTVGGGPSNHGTVFMLNAANNYALTTLAFFDGTNGAKPGELAFDAAGNLYGTTADSGPNNGDQGTVFKLDASNHFALSTLVIFHNTTSATIGVIPRGLIADAAGNLYGTTEGGGAKSEGRRLSSTHRIITRSLHYSRSIGGVVALSPMPLEICTVRPPSAEVPAMELY
jgi:uncharacterized repeat protein (TIGR03803 family)